MNSKSASSWRATDSSYIPPTSTRAPISSSPSGTTPSPRPLTQAPSPDTVIIDTLAEVVEILEITEPERVTALTDFYICTDDYAQYRLKWRPKHALSIILLRAMKLKRPQAIPVLPRYGGCVSWVELEEAINVTGASAVVPDETLRSEIIRIKEAVGTVVPV